MKVQTMNLKIVNMYIIITVIHHKDIIQTNIINNSEPLDSSALL